MSCRLRHLAFNPHQKPPLDYPIHDYGGWGCISGVHYPRVCPKDPALVRFLVIKKKKMIMNLELSNGGFMIAMCMVLVRS